MSGPTPDNLEVRVAILGGGSMAATHTDSYSRINKVRVVGVFSRDLERAAAIARICGAKSVNDAFALLDDPAIDAIDVCVPSANHLEYVVAALERGKHVFCETPLALQLRDVEVMIETARRSGRILLVGLLVRSIAQYEHVHRVAASGQLGELLSVTAYRLGSYLRCRGPGQKEHYTDPTTELMTFDFDFVQWMLGPPTSITATAVNTEYGDPSEVAAILNYDGVKSATVIASGIMPKAFPFSVGFRVLFEKGAFELQTVFQSAGAPKNTFLFHADDGRSENPVIREHNPYEKELRYFVDCIRGEADPELLAAQHAEDALKLSTATQESLRERQAIRLGRQRRSTSPS